MSDKTLLEPGFCYLEVSSCSGTKKVDNKQVKMFDKHGNPMLRVTFSAVDKKGNVGYVSDYFMSSYLPKITNLKHSLGLNKQFISGSQFDMDALANKACGAVVTVEHNDKYGSNNKVVKYVPLAFYKLLEEESSFESKTGNKHFDAGAKAKQEEFDDLEGVPF